MDSQNLEEKCWFLYILRCSDNSLYTGITVNVDERFKKHSSGKGAKYVRTRLPVELIYQEKLNNRVDAMRREIEVKGWTREKKLKLLVS